MFADMPLLICFFIATACDIAIIIELIRHILTNPEWTKELQPFRRAVYRCIFFIIVYVMWIHPYVTFSILLMANKEISRAFWIYFLMIINCLGIFNFFAWSGSSWFFKRSSKKSINLSYISTSLRDDESRNSQRELYPSESEHSI